MLWAKPLDRGIHLTKNRMHGKAPKKGGEMTDRNKMMKAFLEAFNHHDVDEVMSFFVEDCEFDTPRGPTPYGRRLRGKGEVRQGIAARFEGIPDITYNDDSHWEWSSVHPGLCATSHG